MSSIVVYMSSIVVYLFIFVYLGLSTLTCVSFILFFYIALGFNCQEP